MPTFEERSAAEVARMAHPHTFTMPDATVHACATYQEAWLRRRAEAWKARVDPNQIPIYSDATSKRVPEAGEVP